MGNKMLGLRPKGQRPADGKPTCVQRGGNRKAGKMELLPIALGLLGCVLCLVVGGVLGCLIEKADAHPQVKKFRRDLEPSR